MFRPHQGQAVFLRAFGIVDSHLLHCSISSYSFPACITIGSRSYIKSHCLLGSAWAGGKQNDHSFWSKLSSGKWYLTINWFSKNWIWAKYDDDDKNLQFPFPKCIKWCGGRECKTEISPTHSTWLLSESVLLVALNLWRFHDFSNSKWQWFIQYEVYSIEA